MPIDTVLLMRVAKCSLHQLLVIPIHTTQYEPTDAYLRRVTLSISYLADLNCSLVLTLAILKICYELE